VHHKGIAAAIVGLFIVSSGIMSAGQSSAPKPAAPKPAAPKPAAAKPGAAKAGAEKAGVATPAAEPSGASKPAGAKAALAAAVPIDVTVHEGTSMSVAVSPDGRTLAIDLQGGIWTVPAAGGTARRITDVFNDARQPVWSPDGAWIAFFAYRDGGYDLWAVAPDGTKQHKLTWGPYDDREPAFSHDGTRIAFSSDRGDPLGSNYNICVLDLRSGEIRQLTKNPAEDFMPSWSPDDKEIAFASTRETGQGVWAVSVADGAERKVVTTTAHADAAGWGPGGQIVYHATDGTASRLEIDGKPITTSEHVFPFRPSWTSKTDFFYTADGKIRKRTLGAAPTAAAQTVEFTATLQVTPVHNTYARRKRDFDSTVPRKALGIVRPMLSPDGTMIAFAALGDIYVETIGGKPRHITHDAALDTDPAWSPDGSQLVYSSDKGGELMQLWLHDLKTGHDRQLTTLTTQPISPTFSPDGTRIAYLDVDGMWRRSGVSVVEVATGKVTKIHDSLFAPGTPVWSPDGKRVAVAMVSSYSTKYREGTNQILTMSADGDVADDKTDDKWFVPVPNLSIDSRGGCGPAWSPDGTKMAAIYEGTLAIFPVSPSGEPLGPPRHITTEIAHAPSWGGDSRHILYQSNDKLRIIDTETGNVRDVPLDLTYTPAIPTTHLVVHVGKLVDGKSQTARNDVDIVIDGNRIRAIEPHAAGRHAGATLIEAPDLVAMPGLIEFHSHLQTDFGESQGRAFLAFGITTVRSPGNMPYEAVEDREASDAGVRPGPRVYGTGYLLEWQRVYYKMGIAISTNAQLEMELQREKILQHDLIKSYVRMPDLQQRRIVEFAHSIGVPVASHEIYPAALVGMDGTEHTAATSRRGYSPKMTLGRSYEDVVQLFGKAHMSLTPTVFGGIRRLLEAEPDLKNDPRLALYPAWLRTQTTAPPTPQMLALLASAEGTGTGKMVMDVQKAGGRIVAGTDTPNGMNLHAELFSYVQFGMTPYEALRAATVTPAEALGLDAGSIEVGKLADIVLVQGNPLENIANAHKVKRVIANGRVFEIDELLNGKVKADARPKSTAASPH
jgi:Tol biopolymer transport system component/imidazolonepropionase-like amidohydrolase